MSVSIVIAEDHALFRSGLKQLLLLGEGLEVIGEAGDGFEAVTVTVAGRPDLLLLDLSMPGRDGLEVIAHIRKECPDTRILIISMHATSMHIRAAFKAGAHGYLLKTADRQEFLFAIQSVLRGNRYVSTELTGTMIDWCVGEQTEEIASPLDQLTQREREILKLVAEGCSNKETAARLIHAEKTVVTHMTNIMRKLGLRNVREVTMFALECGLIDMKRR